MKEHIKVLLLVVLALVPVSAVALRARIALANVSTADAVHESGSRVLTA